jgi:hypothetical protein
VLANTVVWESRPLRQAMLASGDLHLTFHLAERCVCRPRITLALIEILVNSGGSPTRTNCRGMGLALFSLPLKL